MKFEIKEDDSLRLELSINGYGEVGVEICCTVRGECIDILGWCWLEAVKDHGKWRCKECWENSTDAECEEFESVEDLYHDHFNKMFDLIRKIKATKVLWVSESQVIIESKGDHISGRDGYFLLPIASFVLAPLNKRKRKSKHGRAIHALMQEVMDEK